MMILEDRPYSQDAWKQRKANGRVVRPARPARDEQLLTVRLNYQFTAKFRIPTDAADRHDAIAQEVGRVCLGKEIAPDIQVVEYELLFTPAREAQTIPQTKDQPETFIPAQPEQIAHSFTCRIDGRDLWKSVLSPADFADPNWKQLLAARVPKFDAWSD